MFNIVKKAIDEFNPFGLLPDAPDDEFDSESREIAEKIKIDNTVEEIAEIISMVLLRSFSIKFEIPDCMETADKIHKSMNSQ